MLRIALRMIAQRPAAMIATALALWIAVVIVTACGVLLESGARYHGTLARYAAAPVLVATTSVQVVEGSGEDREAEGTPLATRGPLPAGLPDRIAALPQVRRTRPAGRGHHRRLRVPAGRGAQRPRARGRARRVAVVRPDLAAARRRRADPRRPARGPRGDRTGARPAAGGRRRGPGHPGVSAATGLARGTVFADAAGPVGYPAQGVDPAGLPETLDLDVAAGRLADLHGPAVAVDTLTADALHLGVGDRFQGWYGDGTPADLRVVAVYRRGLGFAAMTLPRDRLAPHTAAGRDGAVLVRATPAGADAVRSVLPPGAQLLPRSAYQVGLDRDLAENAWTQRMVTAVLVAYAVVAAVNALALYTAGRRRELALLRLAGATRSQVVRTVRLERVLLLGLALVLGGAVAAGTLVPMVRGTTGASVPYVPPAGWVAVLGGTVLLGVAGTTLPLRRVLRTRPADAAGIRE